MLISCSETKNSSKATKAEIQTKTIKNRKKMDKLKIGQIEIEIGKNDKIENWDKMDKIKYWDKRDKIENYDKLENWDKIEN